MDTSSVAQGFAEGVTQITTDLGTANGFIWSLFSDFLGLFVQYPLIAFPVLFGLLAGGIALVIRLVKRFGVRGRTR